MRILHLVRRLDDERALSTAREQQRQGHEVTLLLLHDAVLSDIRFEGPVLACQDDLLARRVSGKYQPVDYEGMVKAIFAHDKVISW